MDWNEHVGHDADRQVDLPGLGKLVAEPLAHVGLPNNSHADPEHFQDTTYMSLQVLAHSDQPFACADQNTYALGGFAGDVYRREPACSREMGESLGVARIGLVDPPRESLMRQAGVDADDRLTALLQLSRQLNGQKTTLMNNPVRIRCLFCNERSDLIGVRGGVSPGKHRPRGIHHADETDLTDTSRPT